MILRSYSRNICTLAETKTIKDDVQSAHPMSDSTFYDYIAALEKLFIIDDVDAWCPAIRSKAAIRASKKRNLIDPSVAVAALGLSPEYFDTDFKTLGFLFESLCIRDLKAYSSPYDGRVSYYRDRYGLEADCVLNLDDGRYALIETKLGENQVEEGAAHLCRIKSLFNEANEKERQFLLVHLMSAPHDGRLVRIVLVLVRKTRQPQPLRHYPWLDESQDGRRSE